MWLLGRRFGGGGRPREDLESLYRSSAAAAIEADQEPLRFELDYASWLTAARQYRSGSHRSEERVVDDLLRLPVAFHAERAGTHRYRWGDGLRRAECFDAFALGFRNEALYGREGSARRGEDHGAAAYRRFLRHARRRGALPGAWALNEEEDDEAVAAALSRVFSNPSGGGKSRAVARARFELISMPSGDSDREDALSDSSVGSLGDADEALDGDELAKLLPPAEPAVQALRAALFRKERTAAWAALAADGPKQHAALLAAAETERLAERHRSLRRYDPLYDPPPRSGAVAAAEDAAPPHVALVALSAALEGPGSAALSAVRRGVMLTARSRAFYALRRFRRALADAERAVALLSAAAEQCGASGELTVDAQTASWHACVAHMRCCEAHARRGAFGKAIAALQAAFTARAGFATTYPGGGSNNKYCAGFMSRVHRYSCAVSPVRDEPRYLARLMTHHLPLLTVMADTFVRDVLELTWSAAHDWSRSAGRVDEFDAAGGTVAVRAWAEGFERAGLGVAPSHGRDSDRARGMVASRRSLAEDVSRKVASGCRLPPLRDAGVRSKAFIDRHDMWALFAARLGDVTRLVRGLAEPSTAKGAAAGLCLLMPLEHEDSTSARQDHATRRSQLRSAGGVGVLLSALCAAATRPRSLRPVSWDDNLLQLTASLMKADREAAAALVASPEALGACFSLLGTAASKSYAPAVVYLAAALWHSRCHVGKAVMAPLLQQPGRVLHLCAALATLDEGVFSPGCRMLCELLLPALAADAPPVARSAFMWSGIGVGALATAADAVCEATRRDWDFSDDSELVGHVDSVLKLCLGVRFADCAADTEERAANRTSSSDGQLELRRAMSFEAMALNSREDKQLATLGRAMVHFTSLPALRRRPDLVAEICRVLAGLALVHAARALLLDFTRGSVPEWLDRAVNVVLESLRNNLSKRNVACAALEALAALCTTKMSDRGQSARERLRDGGGAWILGKAASKWSADPEMTALVQAALACVAPDAAADSGSDSMGRRHETSARVASRPSAREASDARERDAEQEAAREAAREAAAAAAAARHAAKQEIEARRRAAQRAANAEAAGRGNRLPRRSGGLTRRGRRRLFPRRRLGLPYLHVPSSSVLLSLRCRHRLRPLLLPHRLRLALLLALRLLLRSRHSSWRVLSPP
jgi:hypothetical protein